MKILVTGGAGFIGSHIVDAFIAAGHTVVVIDNLVTGQKKFLNAKATFYEVDIRDAQKVQEIFSKEKPEILDHHAAQMDVRKSVADPSFDANVNILGLINLMEAGRVHGLKHVIFASSGGAAYGDADELPTSETYPPQPASPYGVSKLSSEYYLGFYHTVYGITSVSLRYGNVYGPRQNPHGEAGVIAIFTKKMLRNEQAVIYGDGEQSRDFVFVKDVVAANLKALEYRKQLVANIGTGKATNIKMIFDTLIGLTNTTIKRVHSDAKLGEQRISILNGAKAKSVLGWEPQIGLTEGLSQTVAFFTHEAKN